VKKTAKLIFIFLLISCALGYGQEEKSEQHPYITLTKRHIGAVKRNIPNRNAKYFDTTYYGKMAEAMTDRAIDLFIKTYGTINTVEKTEIDSQGCKMATATYIKTNKGKFTWLYNFDQAERIQRFSIDTFRPQMFYLAEPLTNKNFGRKDVRIETNAFINLDGFFYYPAVNKKAPLVILVHGSGPHDRNGTFSKNKVYLDITLQLVQKGVGVLIYDKRTYKYQFNDPFPIDSMDYQSETIDDAVAAFKLAKTFKEIDTSKIYIAGHSQGGLCGPLIAKKCSGIKGLILLSAPARSLLEIIPEQMDYLVSIESVNMEQMLETQTAMKWQVLNAQKPDLNLRSRDMLPFGAKPKYWLFDRNYKVLEVAKTLTLPVLLLQGGRDYNVTKKDFDMWNAAMNGKSNFKSVWLENLDHMYFAGVGMSKPENLANAQHVSATMTDKIVEFVK
jgi:pimeloyl-ACP methyl ester carboxylesterase